MELLLLIFSGIVLIGCLVMLIAIWRVAQKPKQQGGAGAVQTRERFISIISHQLRTPLAIVRGYLESLENGDVGNVTDKQKEYLGEARGITKNMIDMVNMYLEVMTKDQSQVKPDLTKFDVCAIIESLVHRFSMYGSATNVEVIAHVPKKPILITSDERLLRGVFENIISNAIKYTEKAGTVTISLIENQKTLSFTCEDTGIGIPEQEQKQLFSRFFRASNIVHRSIAGSGLGLFVSREHMRALGGDITFNSREGKGTTMIVSFPKK